ncbi:MAG: phage holin family protein [Eubacteriales bacterium]
MNILDFVLKQGLILIPMLYIVGMILKGIEIIPDKYIPVILLPVGIAGSFGLFGLSVSSAVQGVFVTGAAVYGNQIVKQLLNQKPQTDANCIA